MNLSAYDSMTPVFTKTWIIPANRKIYSYEMDYHSYYTFLKRYNSNTKTDEYYIALSDKTTDDKKWYTTYKTNSGALKIDLYPIWNISNFSKIKDKQELSVRVENVFDDGIIYYIDV